MRALRLLAIGIVLAASSACASAALHAPRPFPTAPAPPHAPDASAAPAPRALRASGVLSTALDLRGAPYRLGGADPTGFDCSGFVQYVLARHAVAMPRTVAEQFAVGRPAGGVEAGDLVFFRTDGSRVSHVGIALDGESFVHAPSSRGVVRVERLDASYWSSRFIGAKRLF